MISCSKKKFCAPGFFCLLLAVYLVIPSYSLERRRPERPRTGRRKKQEPAVRVQQEPAATEQIDPITVSLPVNSTKVEVTELVPDFTSGKDVKAYTSAFKSKQVDAESKKLSLEIGAVPVLVEEITGQSKKQPTFTISEESPLGIAGYEFDKQLLDVGVSWLRGGRASLRWAAVEPEKGRFDWSKIDAALKDIRENNLYCVVLVGCFNQWDQGTVAKRGMPKKLPRNLAAYQSFLKKAVKRYPFVKAWQIGNEPNYSRAWGDTPQNYLKLLRVSYQAIKQVNPNALILTGGVSDPRSLDKEFWPKFFQELAKQGAKERCFDVFDTHWFLHQGRYMETGEQLAQYIQGIRKKLDEAGYQDAPIWTNEMASYSGTPVLKNRSTGREKALPYISEKQHAGEVVKLYIRALSMGVSKVFWVRLIEYSGFNNKNGYFDNTGLINNPLTDGQSHRKLAYYTYKKLSHILNGVDLKTLEPLDLGKNIQAYKFLKNGSAMYILWAESDVRPNIRSGTRRR